jgi:hypothetical protein
MHKRGEITIVDLGPRKRRVLACEIADHLNVPRPSRLAPRRRNRNSGKRFAASTRRTKR